MSAHNFINHESSNPVILPDTGFTWVRSGLSPEKLEYFRDLISSIEGPGKRLWSLPHDFPMTFRESVVGAYCERLLPNFSIVRTSVFIKSAANNWSLPWHQDRVIAVEEKRVSCASNWSKKDGAWHCEPDFSFLCRMLSVRICLDPESENLGGLSFLAGSHLEKHVERSIADPAIFGSTEAGDALIMSSTLVHRSSVSKSQGLRRAIKFDLCNEVPPTGLKFKMAL